MAGKEATPTIGERLTKDTVKGTLMRVDGVNYWVKDTDGKEVRLHIGTLTGEGYGNGSTNSTIATGNQRDLPMEFTAAGS
jgi:hypothetical protein